MYFCTISDSHRHDPPAIWAYMSPSFQHLQSAYPEVVKIHFVSNGPTMQYRQKVNFYLFSTQLYEQGFKDGGTWNFTEAGHGKGAADSVGSVLKHTADRLVANGQDLQNAEAIYDTLLATDTSVKLYYVPESSIQAVDKILPKQLVPVPGTTAIHQLISYQPSHILYRDVGCACSEDMRCDCYDIKQFRFELPTSSDHTPLTHSDDAVISGVSICHVSAANDVVAGQWCAVQYDEEIYPGIILKANDESVEVSSMARVGLNRYKWPAKDDILHYDYDDVISFIPEPKHVTARHVQIDPLLWSLMV